MKELVYINTNVLWDEMSGIAAEALAGITDVFTFFADEDGQVDREIETAYGTLFYNSDDGELYLQSNQYSKETLLREENTTLILDIADEVNEFVYNYNSMMRNGTSKEN